MKRLIVVDRQVPQWQDLLRGIAPAVEVVVLPPDADGVNVLAEVLRDRAPVQELHILAHGAPGCLYLGTGCLDLAALRGDRAELAQALAPGAVAEIWLYGCNVAAGDAGSEFVAALHRRSGAAIAASTQPVGAGLWVIDPQAGTPAGRLALATPTRAAYPHTLYTPPSPPSYEEEETTAPPTNPPPPEIGRIYVTNPLAGNAVIEDGTNPGPTIADPNGSDGRYSQRFNVVNQTGVSVTLSQFSIQFSETPPGSDVTAYRLEILDDSGVPQPLTSLSLNPRQTSPIQISLKSTIPDGTLIPPGKYIANFVISTSGEPTVYNFPVSWTIPDPTVPGIGNGDGEDLGDALQILSSQNAIAASIAANFADKNGEVPPEISTFISPNPSPGSFSLTARPDLLGSNPPALTPARVNPDDSVLKALTTEPIASLLDNSVGALGTVIQDGESTEEGSPTVGEQFIDVLQDAGTTAATTSVLGSQVIINSDPTTTSSQFSLLGPTGNKILEILKQVTGTDATLSIAANDGTSTASGTGPVRADGSVDFFDYSLTPTNSLTPLTKRPYQLGFSSYPKLSEYFGDKDLKPLDPWINGGSIDFHVGVTKPAMVMLLRPQSTIIELWREHLPLIPLPVVFPSLSIFHGKNGIPIWAAEGTDPNQETVYDFQYRAPTLPATIEERAQGIEEEAGRSLTDENANIVQVNDQSGKVFGQGGGDVLYGGPNITEINGNGGKDVIHACAPAPSTTAPESTNPGTGADSNINPFIMAGGQLDPADIGDNGDESPVGELKANDPPEPFRGSFEDNFQISWPPSIQILGAEGVESADLSVVAPELLPLVLRGGEGDDVLLGCPDDTGPIGKDTVFFGDDGNDQLTGSANNLNSDGFVLGRNRGTDLITNFNPNVDGFYLETARTDKNTGTEYAALTFDELLLTDRRGPVQVDTQTLTDVAYVEIAIAATNEVIARVLRGDRGLSSAQLSGRFAPLPDFLAPAASPSEL